MNAESGKLVLISLLFPHSRMTTEEREQARVHLEEAISIASKKSPSSAMDAGQRYYQMHTVNQMAILAFGKGTRWLAVVRRDEGGQKFEQACNELRALAGPTQTTQSPFQESRKGQWQLGSGEQVFDRPDSHLHAGVLDLLEPALGYVNSQSRDFIIEEVDFRVTVGQSICVETCVGEDIVFAQRVGRKGLSRFVKNRKPEDTQWVTVVLKKRREGGYLLLTAFIGRKAEPEPWDISVTANSLKFWSKHALCWGYEETIPGTETKVCPW